LGEEVGLEVVSDIDEDEVQVLEEESGKAQKQKIITGK
jgi:hypothetical protein